MRHTAFRHLTAAILLAMTATAPAMAQSPVTDPGPATTAAPATEGVQAAPQPVTGEVLPAAEDAATEETAIEEDAAMAATLPHDLSPIGMFMAADIVVKAVMTGLALASIATWTVWLVKSLELAAARRRVRRDLAMLDEVRSLAEAVTGIVTRARGAGIPAGIHCTDPAMARAMRGLGYRFATVGSDLGLMAQAAAASADQSRAS